VISSQQAKIVVGDQQLLRFTVAAEVPASVSEGSGLNAEFGMSAGECVFSLKSEPGVIFVHVVFSDGIRETTDGEEVPVVDADATCSVKDFGYRVSGQFFQAGGVIGKDPRAGVACRVVELTEIHGDKDLAVVDAEVAVVIGEWYLLQYCSLQI